MKMAALTLWQPWATLIAAGVKRIETRSWRPPATVLHRPLAIHAGATIVPQKDIEDTELEAAIIDLMGPDWRTTIPTSAVLCTVKVVNSYRTAGYLDDGYVRVWDGAKYLKTKTDPYGDFSSDRWLWILRDVRPMDPIFPVGGHQGVWTVDFDAAQIPMDVQGALIG